MKVREKMEQCRKKFYEESGEKYAWEVVKWAKDAWRIREVIKTLWDVNDNLLNCDKEKAEGLIKDHFVCNEERRKLEETEKKGEDGK